MNSTAHMTDNNFKKSGSDKKENKVEGLYSIYNMNSTAHMTDNNFKKLGPDKKENKVNPYRAKGEGCCNPPPPL